MLIKNKTFRLIIYIILFFIFAYFGISLICTLSKAINQPYLMSISRRYDFTGYYIMSITYGAICLLSILLFVIVLIVTKKIQNKKIN